MNTAVSRYKLDEVEAIHSEACNSKSSVQNLCMTKKDPSSKKFKKFVFDDSVKFLNHDVNFTSGSNYIKTLILIGKSFVKVGDWGDYNTK